MPRHPIKTKLDNEAFTTTVLAKAEARPYLPTEYQHKPLMMSQRGDIDDGWCFFYDPFTKDPVWNCNAMFALYHFTKINPNEET
jgi:hypothetical protein